MPENISVVWIGFHIEGKPALEAVCAAGFDVKAVITNSFVCHWLEPDS